MRVLLDPGGRLRSAWRLLAFLVVYGITQVLVGILIAIIGIGIFLSRHDSPDGLLLWLEQPAVMLRFVIAAALPQTVTAMLVVWLARRFLDRRPLAELGLRAPANGWGRTTVVGLALGGGPILLSGALLIGLSGYTYMGIQASTITAILVPGLLLAAFHEEIVFRGYLLQNFLENGRQYSGVVLTSFLFALMHSINPSAWANPLIMLNLFGAGVMFSLAYMLSGNIYFPTLLHFSWNVCQGVIFELPVSGLRTDGLLDLAETGTLPIWLTGGEFGLEGTVLITLAEFMIAAVFLRKLRRHKTQRTATQDAA